MNSWTTLIEMANLDEQDTGVPGTIFVSTALGSHDPRVKWDPGRAGRALPCVVLSVEAQPVVRDDFLAPSASRTPVRQAVEWVRLNHVALGEFWTDGASWNRREVSRFLDGLRRVAR